MKFRKALLMSTAAALVLAATSARAATPYFSVFGGVSFLQKPKLTGTRVTHTTTTVAVQTKASIDTSFKTGYVVGAAWGIDWGSFRTELELAGRENHSDKSAHLKTHYAVGNQSTHGFSTGTNRDTSVSSALALRAYSLMANAWYDFHNLKIAGFTPYIGGGIGLAEVQMNGKLDGIKIYEKNQTVLAFQAGGGFMMPIMRATKLFIDYRYFAADGAHLTIEPGFHGANVSVPFDAHSVMVGLHFDL